MYVHVVGPDKAFPNNTTAEIHQYFLLLVLNEYLCNNE